MHLVHRVHNVEKPLVALHSFKNFDKSTVHIVGQEVAEFLERHLCNLGECLGFPEHCRNGLTDGRRGGLGCLGIRVEGGCKTEDFVYGDFGVRRDTGKTIGEVHDVALISGRCSTKLIDCGADGKHRLFKTHLSLQLEYINEFSNLAYGRLRVSAEVFLQRHIDVVGSRNELQEVFLSGNSQLTADTGQRQQLILSGSRVELLEFSTQFLDFISHDCFASSI